MSVLYFMPKAHAVVQVTKSVYKLLVVLSVITIVR